MTKEKANTTLLVVIFLLCIGTISCESTDFVYVDDRTFQEQVSHLKDAYVVIVLKLDPTRKRGYKSQDTATPGLVLAERRFTQRGEISDELCHLISKVIKRNQRYRAKGWYPTYQIYVKYAGKCLFVIPCDKYMDFIFDFSNAHIFVSGRKYVLSKEEVDMMTAKLGLLLKKQGAME